MDVCVSVGWGLVCSADKANRQSLLLLAVLDWAARVHVIFVTGAVPMVPWG